MNDASGLSAFGKTVLIKPDKMQERTAKGVWIPEVHRERRDLAATTGVVIGVGPAAFTYDEIPPETWPRAGDRVVFKKFAALEIEGADGETYFFLNGEDVHGVVTSADVVAGISEAA